MDISRNHRKHFFFCENNDASEIVLKFGSACTLKSSKNFSEICTFENVTLTIFDLTSTPCFGETWIIWYITICYNGYDKQSRMIEVFNKVALCKILENTDSYWPLYERIRVNENSYSCIFFAMLYMSCPKL